MTARGELDRDAAERSVACLADRIASIPEALRVAASIPLPTWRQPPRTLITTGVGASEGPARLLASTLADAGFSACFVPLSAFAFSQPRADLLVVFSQNLSPNARLALTADHRCGSRWLVTSAGYAPGVSSRESVLRTCRERGVIPIVVPPASEDGMLLRVVGPAVASLIAVRIAAQVAGDHLPPLRADMLAHAYVPPEDVAPLDTHPIALVAAGVPVESLHGHRWKVLETLLCEDPPVWDLLQVAHGPLQAIHDRPLTLLAFSTPRALALIPRLQAALSSVHHRLVCWNAQHDDARSFFEHAAAVDACLLATLRARPRNLFDWPGRGGDGPLYDLGG